MGAKAMSEPKVTSGPYDDADVASLNINSKLVNPFVGKTHEEMNDLIDRFMEKTKIDEIYAEHIRKGAYLAQDGEAFEDLREDGLQLKQEERAALVMEDPIRGHKWNQPWILYALVGCCSLGAAVQGWDEVSEPMPVTTKGNSNFDKVCRLLSMEVRALPVIRSKAVTRPSVELQ
ncbi:MAG: hypothetical protein Q9220_003124 [cf. Caloplaca sp. 1 TL-2023]